MATRTPEIPVGLATKVGQIVGSAFALIAAVTTVLEGDLTEETITAMILSALAFYTLMGGRYLQAAAIYRDAPAPKPEPSGLSDAGNPVEAGTMSRNNPHFKTEGQHIGEVGDSPRHR